MHIIQVDNYQDMSKHAAKMIINQVKLKPDAVLGLATGGTPTGTYQEIVQDHKTHHTSYDKIITINLDEYVGISVHHKNSYHQFMKNNLFNHVNFNEANHHLPNGTVDDLQQACERYDQLIDANPIDLQLLGIGQNGHIGFNEPGTPFDTQTHIVELSRSTRKANARFFHHLNDVPTHAITMGIASILQSKRILLLASGYKKAEAMKQLITGPIHEEFPASALRRHDDVTIIADEEALSLVSHSRRSVR